MKEDNYFNGYCDNCVRVADPTFKYATREDCSCTCHFMHTRLNWALDNKTKEDHE